MLKTKQDLIKQAQDCIEFNREQYKDKFEKSIQLHIQLLEYKDEFVLISEQYKEAEKKLKFLKEQYQNSLNDEQYTSESIAFNTLRLAKLQKELEEEQQDIQPQENLERK